MHAVLLGEDEGDNALRQRCLLTVSLNKQRVSQLQTEQNELQKGLGVGGEEEAKGERFVRAKSKAKASVAVLYRHRGHIGMPGHLAAVLACFFLPSFLSFFLFKKVAFVSGLPACAVVCRFVWLVGQA